jgi:hypothetical protein
MVSIYAVATINDHKPIYVWHVACCTDKLINKLEVFFLVHAKEKKRQKGLQDPGQSKAWQSIACLPRENDAISIRWL